MLFRVQGGCQRQGTNLDIKDTLGRQDACARADDVFLRAGGLDLESHVQVGVVAESEGDRNLFLELKPELEFRGRHADVRHGLGGARVTNGGLKRLRLRSREPRMQGVVPRPPVHSPSRWRRIGPWVARPGPIRSRGAGAVGYLHDEPTRLLAVLSCHDPQRGLELLLSGIWRVGATRHSTSYPYSIPVR